VNDYRLPTVSITRGRKTEAAIDRHFGGLLFEELPRELVIVSTDLQRRAVVEHRRGPVGAAVRASLSLPGLYPPARIGQTLHVDGGVLDNLPVRPLADRDEGPVIGVNIAAVASISPKAGPPRMPSLGETLLRSILMAGTATLDDARERAAILVTPDTRGVGLLEFHQIDRARAAGRAAGRATAEALSALLASSARVPHQREVVDLGDPAMLPR
jgi:predicted acylesterase/phospholipase RssA